MANFVKIHAVTEVGFVSDSYVNVDAVTEFLYDKKNDVTFVFFGTEIKTYPGDHTNELLSASKHESSN